MPFIIIQSTPEPFSDYLHEPGSGLEIPGIEATMEYGDASKYKRDRIPGALRINDRSKPDQVRVSEISGLQDDPEVSDSRSDRAGHFGERAGILMPRGRTVGITGAVVSNNVGKMRDLWRLMRSQFGREEKDLVIHVPRETPLYMNEINSLSSTGWTQSATGSTTSTAIADYTEGTLAGVQATASSTVASNAITVTSPAVAWAGEDMWVCALVKVQTVGATAISLELGANIGSGTWVPGGSGTVSSPTTGTYYLLYARMSTNPALPSASTIQFFVRIATSFPGFGGSLTVRIARAAQVLLSSSTPSPLGYVGGELPGFEYEGVPGRSRSYGPCYAVNQVHDPDSTTTSLWANASTSGATLLVNNALNTAWPGDGRGSVSWSINNPSTTSRTLGVKSPDGLTASSFYTVAGLREYRVHLRALVIELFTTAVVQVVWLDHNGTQITMTTVGVIDPVAAGSQAIDLDIDEAAIAPDRAVRAYIRVLSGVASTTTGDKFTMMLAEPRFFDVSEYDPGETADMDSTTAVEHGLVTYKAARSGLSIALTPSGARRRIPRPFLLRDVRSVWDGKAPESQRSLQARRDFTMSLRAGDPRVYVLDERHGVIRASLPAQSLSFFMSAFQTAIDGTSTQIRNDDFTGATLGAALSGRVAPSGGTWGTNGTSGTDFTFSNDLGGVTVKRTAAPNRYGFLGSALVAQEVWITIAPPASVGGILDAGNQFGGVVGRFVDSNNVLRGDYSMWDDDSRAISLEVDAGGVLAKQVGDVVVLPTPTTPVTLRLRAFPSGWCSLEAIAGGSVVYRAEFGHPSMATGGTVASGMPGIYDEGPDTHPRYYDNFIVYTPAADPAGAPTNFSVESSSLDNNVRWQSTSLGALYPLNGMGLSSSEITPPPSGYLAQDSVQRVYYSAGSLTYTTPEVTVSGNCINGSGFDYDLFSDSLIGGVWQYNYIGAVLKRVTSGVWIEARLNSANHDSMNAAHASPAAPYSLELWSSHNTSGSAAVTRLGQWDIPVSSLLNGERKNLRTYMDESGVIYVELWGFNGHNFSDTGLISRQTYTLPGPLSTLYGPTVAGRPGMSIKLAQWDDGTETGVNVDTMKLNYDVAYISTFSSIDFATSMLLMTCPVIGDTDDVPLRLRLSGEMDTPTIMWTNVDTGDSAMLKLSGVFSDSDPVTVDMDAGTIRSDSGLDYFARRQLGSRFFSLKPGRNIIAVNAVGWNTSSPSHVVALWRDCLR